MRKSIITLCMMLSVSCGWAQTVWTNLSSYCDNDRLSLTPTEVEFKQDETILHLRVQNSPGGGVGFSGIKLKDENGKMYALKHGDPTRLYEDKCLLGQYNKVPMHGIMNFALHFEPVTNPTTRLHAYTGYGYYDFKMWNIHQVKPMEISLFNSNWRDEKGDWVLGLYESGAVYDSKVYSYEEKSDKKVVLTNGNEKLTIAIGKEKNGKRQFKINNQKLDLECFGAEVPAYPTEDNTAFSTDYTSGEAEISGWIKDFPKEISESEEAFGISVKVQNMFTGELEDYNKATIDKDGKFTIKVKVKGTQSVIFNEFSNKVNVYEVKMILQPGKKYFMVHNWETAKCMFMGEDARLQNELQAFPCKYEWKTSIYVPEKEKSIDSTMTRFNDYIAKNPTLSKRYRDYILQEAQLRVLTNLIRSDNATEAARVASKFAAVNTSLPISLIPALYEYCENKYQDEYSKARQKYTRTPELFLSFEKQGKIQLSDSEREILKKWQQYEEEIDKLRECESQEEMMEKYKKIQDMYPREELNAFFSKEEVSKAYSEWAPSNDQIQKNVIESLFTDQTMRDFCRSLILGKVLQQVKSLPDDYSQLYDDIKNEDFKQQINGLKDYYAEQQRQNEEKVKGVIAPNSNVAGLTDGKAIVEKMIEPYKGKIIYMDVWGTWCQPCVQAIKASPTLKDAVKDYDVVYLYFEYGSPESVWKSAIADLNLIKPNYVHYQLPSEQQEAVIKYLKVDGFPSYFLFDKNGNMESLDRGHIGDTNGFKKKIEELSKK